MPKSITRPAVGILAAALLLPWASTAAQAAPAQYRQLDDAGLVGVLPTAAEAPRWLGRTAPTQQGEARVATPTQGIAICSVGEGSLQDPDDETDIRGGARAERYASRIIEYGRYRPVGWSQVIFRIFQFPSAVAAEDAWAQLLVSAEKCTGTWTLPYPDPVNDTFNGTQAIQQTVRPGSAAFGSRSLIRTSTALGTRTGAASPDRTGSAISEWRRVGNVIYEVNFGTAVQGEVPTAVSPSDRLTVNALSALIGERYLSVTAR